jgi:signal transduction histidine kinase
MKLINKISRYFLLSSMIIFVIVSVGLYFVIENAITEETDEQLLNIVQKAKQELKNGQLVSFSPFVEIFSIEQENEINEFKDVLINSKQEFDGEPFRQLTSFVNVNGKHYKIIARISLIEKEDMLFSILIVALAAFVLFILVLYFTNKTVSKNILKDFYNTLNKLENFSLKNYDELKLVDSKINEFKQLNKSVLYLSKKAKSEYCSLKEFSEEINHEIQTPIAVIKSKLEILLQDCNLSEENLSLLDSVLKNLSKFERINKSILLLNKLEHIDLFESVELNIKDELEFVVVEYSDAIASKNLTVNYLQKSDLIVRANQPLINILLSNLVSNAIKHNFQNGKIDITIRESEFIISNTGNKPKGGTDKFFERFYKESDSNESIGLGLTIVQKICDVYKILIRNNFSANLHTVVLNFVHPI